MFLLVGDRKFLPMSLLSSERSQYDSLQFLKIGSMKHGLTCGKYKFSRAREYPLLNQSCFSSRNRETITPIFWFLSCWFTA